MGIEEANNIVHIFNVIVHAVFIIITIMYLLATFFIIGGYSKRDDYNDKALRFGLVVTLCYMLYVFYNVITAFYIVFG